MSRAADIIIYHNPACSTSRKVLAGLREHGHEPRVIEYLKTPPSRSELKALLKQMELTPRGILRRSGTPYDELALDNAALTDDQLLDAIEAHPILIQRPIVVSSKGARLCRPMERYLEVL
ncbi:MAG: arsenate reductase (glutaredoxin) [Alphaproteobacteria bacterium]|nr:arsenate reductase (glutaredoxin) [Alphaproteobacteria bacterium]